MSDKVHHQLGAVARQILAHLGQQAQRAADMTSATVCGWCGRPQNEHWISDWVEHLGHIDKRAAQPVVHTPHFRSEPHPTDERGICPECYSAGYEAAEALLTVLRAQVEALRAVLEQIAQHPGPPGKARGIDRLRNLARAALAAVAQTEGASE